MAGTEQQTSEVTAPAPFVIPDLQEFHAALSSSGIALADLTHALRCAPRSVKAIVRTARRAAA